MPLSGSSIPRASTKTPGPTVIDVLANDDPGPDEATQTLHVESVGTAGNGSVIITNGGADVTYTPDPDFHGLDGFTYTLCDDGTTNGSTDPICTLVGTQVNVTINAVNDEPEADADTADVDEDGPAVIIDVLDGDTDVDGDTLVVDSVDDTGTIGTVTSNGTDVTYDPDDQFEPLAAGETATDTFSYVVSDGNGGSDTATVTVTIYGQNDAPVLDAIGDQVGDEEVELTFTATATDVDADRPPGLHASTATRAGAVITADGVFTWTPTEAQGPGEYLVEVCVVRRRPPGHRLRDDHDHGERGQPRAGARRDRRPDGRRRRSADASRRPRRMRTSRPTASPSA